MLHFYLKNKITCVINVTLILLVSQYLFPVQILKRETALATAAVYESMFAAEDGTIPATYQVNLVLITSFIGQLTKPCPPFGSPLQPP